jgi:hypothetical protein
MISRRGCIRLMNDKRKNNQQKTLKISTITLLHIITCLGDLRRQV